MNALSNHIYPLISGLITTTTLFFLSLCVSAQEYKFGYNSINYNINSGFPSSELHFGLKDSENFFWFATDKGLARYNGIGFENYNNTDNLSDNNINHIFEDSNQKIWFLGDYSLSYFDLKTNTLEPYRFNNEIINYNLNSPLQAVFIKGKTIFIVLKKMGYLVINENGKIKFQNKKVSYDRNFGFYVEENEEFRPVFWKGTPISQSKTKQVSSGPFNEEFYTNSQNIISLSPDKSSFLLRKYSSDAVTKIEIGHKINSVSFAQNPNTVLVSTNNGIIKYIQEFDQKIPFLKSQNINYSIDGSKIGLFALSENNGLYKIPNNGTLSLYKNNSIYENPVIELIPIDNQLNIFGSSQLKISYSDFSFKNSTSTLALSSLHRLSSNTFKVPIALVVPNNYTFSNIPAQKVIYCKSFDKCNNMIFMQTVENGILEVSNNTIRRIKGLDDIYPKTNTISCYKNKIWLGTNTGWYFYYFKTDKLFLAKTAQIYNITKILNFKEDKLVFSTKNKGFIVYDGSFYKKITTENGLVSNLINDFEIENNNLWTASSEGVVKLSYVNGQFVVSDAYTFSDGLNSPDINDIAYFQDEVFASSKNGLNKIKPILKSKNNLKVFLNSIYIENDRLPLAEEITVPYRKSLEIDFTVSSFNSRSPKVYYRLKEVNKEFRLTQNLQVLFESLNSGQYTLEYYAQDYIESTPIKSITINVKTPWYLKWYTLLIALAILGYLAYYLLKRNSEKISQKYKQEQENNRYKLLAFNKQMSSHFISNSFNAINNFILRNDNVGGSKYLSRMSRLFRHSLLATEKNYIPFNQEIEAISSYIELEKLRYNNSFDFEIEVENKLKHQKIEIMPLVLQTLIENAIWHGLLPSTQEKKFLSVIVKNSEYPNLLKIEIKDNGIGIDIENYQKEDSKGISLVRAILETNPYTKPLESEKIITFANITNDVENKGTICTVFVPVIYSI